MEPIDYAELYANTIKTSKPEDLEKINTLFKDKYGYEAPSDEVGKIEPVQPTETDTDVQVNVSTSSSSGVSSNTNEVVEEKPAVVTPEVTKDPKESLEPSAEWDIKQTNEYNMIANTRARIVDLRNEGNNRKANSYGYDLRQMENRYKNKYGIELPEEMVPYRNPYEAVAQQDLTLPALPDGFNQLIPRGSNTLDSLESTKIIAEDGDTSFVIDWEVDGGERTGSGTLRFGDKSVSFNKDTNLKELVKIARKQEGFPTEDARVERSATLVGKVDTKGKELEIKYNKKMDELFNGSEVIQRFKSAFDTTVEPKMEQKVQELFGKYPDASTNPDKLKLLQDELQKYYSVLWKKAAGSNETIKKEEQRIMDLVQEEHSNEYNAYVESLKPEARAEWDKNPINQGLDVLKASTKVASIGNPVVDVLNRLFNSKFADKVAKSDFVDQAAQSFVFSPKSIKNAGDAQLIAYDAAQVRKQLSVLEKRYEDGDITKG